MQLRTCVGMALVAVLHASAALAAIVNPGVPGDDPTAVVDLPGLPETLKHLKMSSGYLDVHPETERQLFYWAVWSQGDPASDPIVLWLNGGPGCSSVGGGLMTENGPFYPTADGLIENPHSWTKAATVVFLDSPSWVGFSHSRAGEDLSAGDARTADDVYHFVQSFLAKYAPGGRPATALPFWVTGESYGGHYVPWVTRRIAHGNANGGEGGAIVDLRGFQVGNAWTQANLNNMGCIVDWIGHTVVAEDTAGEALATCAFDSIGPLVEERGPRGERVRGGDPARCDAALSAMYKERGNINIYQMYEPLCDARGVEDQGRRLMREVAAAAAGAGEKRTHRFAAGVAAGMDESDAAATTGAPGSASPCVGSYAHEYLNRADVQRAIHVAPTPYSFNLCSRVLNYSRTDLLASVVPLYEEMYTTTNLTMLVYSGDIDGIVSTAGDKLWIQEFAKRVGGLPVKDRFAHWTADGLNVGGWRINYQDGPQGARFMHSTVRGAGHMVPGTQPQRSFYLFSKILKGEDPVVANS